MGGASNPGLRFSLAEGTFRRMGKDAPPSRSAPGQEARLAGQGWPPLSPTCPWARRPCTALILHRCLRGEVLTTPSLPPSLGLHTSAHRVCLRATQANPARHRPARAAADTPTCSLPSFLSFLFQLLVLSGCQVQGPILEFRVLQGR